MAIDINNQNENTIKLKIPDSTGTINRVVLSSSDNVNVVVPNASQVIENEKERIANENQRIANETSRQSAELSREATKSEMEDLIEDVQNKLDTDYFKGDKGDKGDKRR